MAIPTLRAVTLSMVLASAGLVTQPSKISQVGQFVARLLGRSIAIVLGFILTMLGLGMTATVVLLPLGVVTAFVGIGVFLSGIFAPETS